MCEINTKIYKNNLSVLNFAMQALLTSQEIQFILKHLEYLPKCTEKDIVKVEIEKKEFYQNSLRPSVDTDIHIEIYKYLKDVGCIIHAQRYSTIIAQSNIEPKCYGTTHADYFYDRISSEKIYKVDKSRYEYQLGRSIIKKLKKIKKYNPGILLRDHGLVAWGKNEQEAINNLIAIEFICRVYYKTKLLIKKPKISKSVHKFHFERKHGKKSYYGQKK